MKKILLVEDEKNFAQVLKDYLRMNDYDVVLCENGVEAMEVFRSNKFDLCIVDVMMPKKDGFTLTAEIKAFNNDTPLIFLTARSMRDDMVKGYKLGADDYIVKPFDSELLLLKIQAILNRNHIGQITNQQSRHQIGKLDFDAALRSLKISNEEEIRLSPKESALLNLLCQHRDTILPREKALKQIWKEDTYFTGRSMDVYIVKLRKYLSADKNLEIKSLHGDGYTLTVKE